MELYASAVAATKTKCDYFLKSDGAWLSWWGYRWGSIWVKSGSIIIESWALWQQEIANAVTNKNLWGNGGRGK